MNNMQPHAFLATFVALSFSFCVSAAVAQTLTPEQQLLAEVKGHPKAKLGPLLANLHDEYAAYRTKKGKKPQKFQSVNPIFDLRNGSVVIDGVTNDPEAMFERLVALGATNVRGGAVFSAHIPVRSLGALADEHALLAVRPALAKAWGQGNVVSQGDRALGTDDVRKDFDVSGDGIRLAALSDSFGSNPGPFAPGQPTSTPAEDFANDEIPADTVIAQDNISPDNIDEGRAMIQLMHDVAPGSPQAFHTAFDGQFDFACGIMELGGITAFGAFNACNTFNAVVGDPATPYTPLPAELAAQVIVDDVIYFAEPMFSDGAVGQAADVVYDAGIPYFSSAGNNARLSYEAPYNEVEDFGNNGNNLNRGRAPGPNRMLVHDFDETAGESTAQRIRVFPSNGGAVVLLVFQWDQPFLFDTAFANLLAGNDLDTTLANIKFATTDLDLLFYKDNGALVQLCPPGLAVGITCQLSGSANIFGDPLEFAILFYAGPPSKPAVDFKVRIVNSGQLPGAPEPTRIKYVPVEFQGFVDIVDFDTQSGTSYGHANAAGAAAIGASAWYATENWLGPKNPAAPTIFDSSCAPACLNDFSSAGGVPVFFDGLGNPLPEEMQVRDKPLVTGPDGGNTTFFFFDSNFDDDDGDGCNSPFSTFITDCLDEDGGELPNFFGTSASAPHVAAVAGLMLEKAADLGIALTPDQVYQILADTAKDMSNRYFTVSTAAGPAALLEPFDIVGGGFDYDSGYGFVDAAAALAAVEALAAP
jgi:hypothetical protein